MDELIARYWSRVEKSDDGCWIWCGSRSSGYGTMGWGGQSKRATHIAVFLRDGKWPPKGLFVCHSCDNPPCVNPDHLWVGTIQENNADRDRKGRQVPHLVPIEARARGEAHGSVILTKDQVLFIRSSPEDYSALARRFGVSKSTTRLAKLGKTWKHLPMPALAASPKVPHG